MKLSLLHLHHEMMPYQEIDSNLNKLKEKKLLVLLLQRPPNPANFFDFFFCLFALILHSFGY